MRNKARKVSYSKSKSMSNELLWHRIYYLMVWLLFNSVPLILLAAAITFTKHLQAFLYYTSVFPPIISILAHFLAYFASKIDIFFKNSIQRCWPWPLTRIKVILKLNNLIIGHVILYDLVFCRRSPQSEFILARAVEMVELVVEEIFD